MPVPSLREKASGQDLTVTRPGCGPAALLSFHINPRASMPDISSTMRLRLLLAYDGSRYCGWQIQDIPTPPPTV